MIVRGKAWHICVPSLVFFVACQLSTLVLLSETLVCNSGIGFGITIPVFVLIPAVAISLFFIGSIFQTILRKKTSGYLAIVGGGFFFGGALSNIADRLTRGCVPDYFHIGWFPAFNVADIGISGGVIILIIAILRK